MSAFQPFWLRRHAVASVLILILSLEAALFLWFGWRAIRFPYPLDYGEGPLLDQAERLGRGANIYRIPNASPPWTISNYPPVYVLAETAFAVVFGPAYWYGRLVSVLSIAGSAVLIALILTTITKDRLAAIVGGLMLPLIPFVSAWSELARVDDLGLALSLGGLYCAARWPDRWVAVVASVTLLIAAVYTRQSFGLAAPAAAFVSFFCVRRRYAVVLAAGMAALGLAAGAMLQLLSKGGFFFNIVTANVNDYSVTRLWRYVHQTVVQMPLLVAAAGLLLVLAKSHRLKGATLVVPYLIGAALTAATIGKIGSNVNYLLEAGAAMSLSFGALLAWLRKLPVLRQIAMLALTLQMLWFLQPTGQHAKALNTIGHPDTLAALMATVKQSTGPVLADDAIGLLPLAGKQIQLQPFEMAQLARAGVWDQTPLLNRIDAREYAKILVFHPPGDPLDRDRWTEEMLAHIDRSYEVHIIIKDTVIYEPRDQ